jgi:hypothetical protein
MTDRAMFEDRLLRQLLDELPEHPGQPVPGRRRRLVFAAGALGTAVAGALAAALVIATSGAAYAIRPRPDGSFDVVLSGTDSDYLADVERDLKQRGAPIELVPRSQECLGVLNATRLATPPHPAPSFPEFDAFRPVVGDDGTRRNPITGAPLKTREWAFTVQPRLIPAGKSLWIAVGGTDGATLVLVVQFAPPTAEPDFCAHR